MDKINNNVLENFDIYYIPGGKVIDKFTTTKKANKLKEYIQNHYNDKNKIFAALCAAPYIYNHWGILKNRKVTTYPSIETQGHYENKIANGDSGSLKDRPRVYVDKNIITGNGPGSSFQFAYKLLEMIEVNPTDLKLSMQFL